MLGIELQVLKAKLRGTLDHLRHLPRALNLVWAAARYWTLAWVALLAVQGLLPVATVYLTRWLVDSLVAALGAGDRWQSVRPLLIPAALMAGIKLLMELLRSAANWIRAVQAELLRDHISGLIHGQSTTADLAFYEVPEYYDHLHRAREEASYRPVTLVESLGSLLQDGITLCAMGVVLIEFGLWLPAALLVSTLPAFYVVLHYTLRQHQWRLRATADERRTWYYDWLLTARETAAEVRLFGLGEHFRSAYRGLRRRLREGRLRIEGEQSLAELGAGALALLITGAAMAWMGWQALQGAVTLGTLALFYQAFIQGQSLVRSLLQHVSQLYANSLFLGNLFDFLALSSRVVDPVHPDPAPEVLREGICFHQVTFNYPGSRQVVLSDFSLTIPAGQVVAMVGPNGAGKSTLIKLLCRFYDPDTGRIELDGIDLRRFQLGQLRRLITVLFQEPVHYNATVAENIALGDLAVAPGPAEIRAAAQAAGAEEIISRLPQGYDHLLGKMFESGAELSVGEWQRLALARAFLRRSPILLLDEPTSAMDSWAEADWLRRFRRLASGRTVVIITHRFTTAMHADMIYVMADGRLVESGSHGELLTCGGRYAQSWAAQMKEMSKAQRAAPEEVVARRR